MRQNSEPGESAEQHVQNIRRATRKRHSAEDKIRIVLSGLRGEYSIAELCRREGIAQSLYYSWSKDFLEAGKKRLAGDTERQASSGSDPRIERWHQTLKNRILLENYYLPGDLEAQIDAFVGYYNHRRYHESLNNLTPADVYFGRGQTILLRRDKIKTRTIEQRRLLHAKAAA